ncbi:MAG: Tad domain-containing protein [Acidobacteria bacterium]|nr:Tad domain-containing protein [Acidobacteriota bacterium]
MKKEIAANLSHRKNERGNVLAYTVISVLFLFLAVGLGADLSHLYLVRTELQNAADAAALAGASALLLPEADRIPTAVQRAVDTLNKNKYNFNSQEFEDVVPKADQPALITFAVNLDGPYVNAATAAGTDNIRFVKVDTPTVDVNIFFAIPILGLARNMTGTATAGLSVQTNVFCNYIPIAVVEGPFGGGVGWQDFNGDGVKDYATDCSPPAGAPACDPNTKFCPGCRYKMIAGPGNWEDTSPGNYQALDAGSGAKDLKLAIAGGASACLRTNEDAEFITETEPGRMTGPIQKGLNTRFDDYKAFGGGGTVVIAGVSKPIEEAFPPDPNIYENAPKNKNDPYPGISRNTYEDPSAPKVAPKNTPAEGRREILMPIINQSEFDAGRDTVKFTKFGKFFLNRKVGGIPSSPEIYVEYMSPAFGSGGFDPEGGPTAPIVVPVLYR